jgi:hypothetical protein
MPTRAQTATLMAESILNYSLIAAERVPPKVFLVIFYFHTFGTHDCKLQVKSGADLVDDKSILQGSMHMRVDELRLILREPVRVPFLLFIF